MLCFHAAQTGKHLLRIQNVSEQNQKKTICVRNKCCARGQTGKHLCRQQCVRNKVSSFARALSIIHSTNVRISKSAHRTIRLLSFQTKNSDSCFVYMYIEDCFTYFKDCPVVERVWPTLASSNLQEKKKPFNHRFD